MSAAAVAPVRFVVYSDWLCPWCYLGAARLWRLEAEHPGQVELEWRSYLLRPYPNTSRSLDDFRAYTRTWARPAAEPDAPAFRQWESDAGPPSHSMPPHLVAKAVDALERLPRDDRFRVADRYRSNGSPQPAMSGKKARSSSLGFSARTVTLPIGVFARRTSRCKNDSGRCGVTRLTQECRPHPAGRALALYPS